VVVVSLIVVLINVIVGSIHSVGGILNFVIGGPIAFGMNYYFLSFARGNNPELEDLFKGFSQFLRNFVAYLLMVIFTLLWALLLIVPGIIAAISYSMTFYIMIDNPQLDAQDAIKKSKVLMNGNKYRYFCLLCRFIGWFLLCLLTLGIGFLWLIPYFMVSTAKFYDSLDKGSIATVNHI
jgi:uncharacterized membrane protein